MLLVLAAVLAGLASFALGRWTSYRTWPISFEHEDGVTRRVATSDADGRYELSLPYGRYHCVVTHPSYAAYSTGEGWGIVDDKATGFWNFVLTP